MVVELTVGRWSAGKDEVGGLVVRSPSGRLWYPSLLAEQITRGDLRCLIQLARESKGLGTWG